MCPASVRLGACFIVSRTINTDRASNLGARGREASNRGCLGLPCPYVKNESDAEEDWYKGYPQYIKLSWSEALPALPYAEDVEGSMRVDGREVYYTIPAYQVLGIGVGEQGFGAASPDDVPAYPDSAFCTFSSGLMSQDYVADNSGAPILGMKLLNPMGEWVDAAGERHRANRPGRRTVGIGGLIHCELPSTHWSAAEGWTQGPHGIVPVGFTVDGHHAANLIEAWPHDHVAGPTVVYIRGWFGDDMVGEDVADKITFRKDDEEVEPSSAVVMIDDPYNRDIVQAIRCEVDFTEAQDKDYVGLWDVKLDEVGEAGKEEPFTVEKALSVLKMELLDANTMEERSAVITTACGPTIELDPLDVSDASITEDGQIRIHLSGTVRDKVADIVPRTQGSYVTKIFVEEQELAVTDQNPQTSDARPYAYEGRFDGYVVLGMPTAKVVYEVVTEENALGRVGRATFLVAGHVEERQSSGGSYLLSPFSIRIGQEFAPDVADTIWMLLPSNISFTIDTVHDPADPLDPANPDQITFTIGTEPVTLTEDGAQSLRFVGTSTSHGQCVLVLDSMTGLSTQAPDESGGTVSIGDVCAGAALRYFFLETGDATYRFGGEREVALSEDAGALDSQLFEADAADHGHVSVEVSSFTGLRALEPDSLIAAVELPSAWTGVVILPLAETDVNSGLFDYVVTSSDIAGEPELAAVIDSVLVGTATGEGTFVSYFVRISDPTGQQKDHVTVGGVDLELETVAGQDGVYITKEPFAALREAGNVTDTRLIVNAGDLMEWGYNPSGSWPHGDVTIPNFFAGPFYVNGVDMVFDQNTEGLIQMTLNADVDDIAVTVYPKSQPANVVYELPATDAANMKSKGTYRFWDGKTNKTGSTDFDGRPNNHGTEWKYVDPAFDVHVLRIVTTKAGRQEGVTVEFSPRAKRLWVYNGADRGEQDRPIAEPYASDGLAYQEAGLVHGFGSRTVGGQTTSTLTNQTGMLRASRFAAQGDPDAPAVVYDYADGLTFGEVFERLTARGELTSIGHGAGRYGIWLDGGDHTYSGFVISDTIGGADDGPYGLPYLGVHGVTVSLKHCFTARYGADSQINQMLNVLTNDGGGVGGGTVAGYEGYHYVKTWTRMFPLQDLTGDQVIDYHDRAYGALTTGARAAISAPVADRMEVLKGLAREPVIAGATELAVWAPGFERPGGTGHFQDGETFSYSSFVYSRSRFRFTGCTGLQEHAARARFRHPSRGSDAYFARWALSLYPIEAQAQGGRVDRFSSENLHGIDLGDGVTGDQVFRLAIGYITELEGGDAVEISGGN